ncbi:STAS-like domain-containing protein [Ruegeria atlantica]|uniref:DUF4325 domain-containing protein n=1 Tax=Ruegeria atlantica TaxID=81569 RepID=A0A0P1EBM5_9RHOB|nr:STAS-like domain-containing protein [Ruegeria atlantica]CUH46338.1 hypothetical protein RUA4292_00503 [Ruegeria atlantica]
MVVYIRDIVDGCDTNAQGAVLSALLDANLSKMQSVTLDFTDVFNVTSSFVNTAFVDLMDRHDLAQFKQHVKLRNVNRQIATLVKSRLASMEAKSAMAA